jgi:hypothetical protein
MQKVNPCGIDFMSIDRHANKVDGSLQTKKVKALL